MKISSTIGAQSCLGKSWVMVGRHNQNRFGWELIFSPYRNLFLIMDNYAELQQDHLKHYTNSGVIKHESSMQSFKM